MGILCVVSFGCFCELVMLSLDSLCSGTLCLEIFMFVYFVFGSFACGYFLFGYFVFEYVVFGYFELVYFMFDYFVLGYFVFEYFVCGYVVFEYVAFGYFVCCIAYVGILCHSVLWTFRV